MENEIFMVGTMAGIMAAFFASINMLPQVIKCWKTKDTKALSMNMIMLSLAGNVGWVINGVIFNNVALMGSSIFIIILLSIIIVFKIRYEFSTSEMAKKAECR